MIDEEKASEVIDELCVEESDYTWLVWRHLLSDFILAATWDDDFERSMYLYHYTVLSHYIDYERQEKTKEVLDYLGIPYWDFFQGYKGNLKKPMTPLEAAQKAVNTELRLPRDALSPETYSASTKDMEVENNG